MSGSAPFFSVCIPQYNRTSFLIESCRSLQAQTFRDFEVCISDDRSTDGRRDELETFLKGSGLRYIYEIQPVNGRYDVNLRAAIEMASGEYCLLLGNDDAIEKDGLAEMAEKIRSSGKPAVAFCNYAD